MIYVGIGGKARKIKDLYVGIGGKARKVTKGYIGIGGKARLFYSSGYIDQLTDPWTGRRYLTSSGSWGYRTQNSGNTSTDQINTYATVIGNQMTVYGNKTDTNTGQWGEAIKLTSSKVRLTNGKNVTVTLSVQSAGAQYGRMASTVRFVYGSSKPLAGSTSITKNLTLGTSASVTSNLTQLFFTFTGTTGDYYIGVYLLAVNGSDSVSGSGVHIGGQITVREITVG